MTVELNSESTMKVDQERLRRERLAKLQAEMAKRDIGGLFLTNPVNIRYATDISVMHSWTSVNIARYAFVPAVGDPVIFEYGHALFRADQIWPRSRKATTWQYRFAQNRAPERASEVAAEVKKLLKEAVGESVALRLGIDTLDFYGFEALANTGMTICDADETMQAARLTKTVDELVLIEQSRVVAEEAMAALEAAIKPGVTENELLAVFHRTMLARGAEHCSTRLLASGERTNPWFNEAGDRQVLIGDLVAFDTDMIGPEGYLCDFSRTFLCGEKANSDQLEATAVAREFIDATIELLKPGTAYIDLCRQSPEVHSRYQEQCYSCMIHGIGLDDEPPFIPYRHALGRHEESIVMEGEIQPNTILCVEFYAGKKGARDGVKLEEQVLITANGPVKMTKQAVDPKLCK